MPTVIKVMQISYDCKSFQLLKTKLLICTGNHHRKLRYEMCKKSIWVPFWAIDLVMLTARLRLCYTLGFTHLEALYVELIGTTNWPTERDNWNLATQLKTGTKRTHLFCVCVKHWWPQYHKFQEATNFGCTYMACKITVPFYSTDMCINLRYFQCTSVQ